jgi:hypothetical protein
MEEKKMKRLLSVVLLIVFLPLLAIAQSDFDGTSSNCTHRRKHAWDNIAKFSDAKANFFQAGFSITDSGIRRSEGVDCALIQRSARSSMADEVTNSQSD